MFSLSFSHGIYMIVPPPMDPQQHSICAAIRRKELRVGWEEAATCMSLFVVVVVVDGREREI
jgi:hypothetical protein